MSKNDAVNHPSHYQGSNGVETIDAVEGFELGFHDGNAVTYICRARTKGKEKQDIQKAIWYLVRHYSNRFGLTVMVDAAGVVTELKAKR